MHRQGLLKISPVEVKVEVCAVLKLVGQHIGDLLRQCPSSVSRKGTVDILSVFRSIIGSTRHKGTNADRMDQHNLPGYFPRVQFSRQFQCRLDAGIFPAVHAAGNQNRFAFFSAVDHCDRHSMPAAQNGGIALPLLPRERLHASKYNCFFHGQSSFTNLKG